MEDLATLKDIKRYLRLTLKSLREDHGSRLDDFDINDYFNEMFTNLDLAIEHLKGEEEETPE